MRLRHRSLFRRLWRDRRGTIAVIAALAMSFFFALAGIVIDVADLYQASELLQASANAAAIAGAASINHPAGSAFSTATQYSAVSGNLNAPSNFTVTMAPCSGAGCNGTTYPQLKCLTSIGGCTGTASLGSGTTPDNANAIAVIEQADVPLYFFRIFGLGSVKLVSAGALACPPGCGGAGGQYNVAIVLDTTASMGTGGETDCGNYNEPESCASAGIQGFLEKVNPAVVTVSLFVFPGVGTATDVSAITGCKGNQVVEPYGTSASTIAATASGSDTLTFPGTPAFYVGAALPTGYYPTALWQMSDYSAAGASPALRAGFSTEVIPSYPTSSSNYTYITAINPGTVTGNTSVTAATYSAGSGAHPQPTITFTTSTSTGIASGNSFTTTGFSPAGYNGSWTATTGTSGTTVVADASSTNPGTVATKGTLAYSTSGTTVTLSQDVTGAGVANGDTVNEVPLYQVTTASSSYQGSTAGTLNSSDPIVEVTNCGLNHPTTLAKGGESTFYADAITTAQSYLANSTGSKQHVQNVIIFISDGQANDTAHPLAPATWAIDGTLVASNSDQANADECQQAIVAAQKAAQAGTWVITAAYGSSSSSGTGGGCTTDNTALASLSAEPACPTSGSSTVPCKPATLSGISSCTVEQYMASKPGVYPNSQFFLTPPSTESGGTECPGGVPVSTVVDLLSQTIPGLLSGARLLPLGTS